MVLFPAVFPQFKPTRAIWIAICLAARPSTVQKGASFIFFFHRATSSWGLTFTKKNWENRGNPCSPNSGRNLRELAADTLYGSPRLG
jgi:hypothetical protein